MRQEAEAGTAWSVYKESNGIAIGTVSSQSAKQQYLKSLVDDYRTPSFMKADLAAGKVPQGYNVHHIVPLYNGGLDIPSNMALQGIDLHKTHHKMRSRLGL